MKWQNKRYPRPLHSPVYLLYKCVHMVNMKFYVYLHLKWNFLIFSIRRLNPLVGLNPNMIQLFPQLMDLNHLKAFGTQDRLPTHGMAWGREIERGGGHVTLKNTHTLEQRKFLSYFIGSFIWVGDVLQKDRSKGPAGLLHHQAFGIWNTCQTCHVQFTVDRISQHSLDLRIVFSFSFYQPHFFFLFAGNNSKIGESLHSNCAGLVETQ